jgi:hypothetical protein
MAAAGFRALRLSLETINEERQKASGKVTCLELASAVESLRGAGIPARNISVYYMVGVPGQEFEDIVDTLSYIASLGVNPMPLPYSLIPGTVDWLRQIDLGVLPPDADPLLSNKECLPFHPVGKSRADYKQVLRLARVVRNFGKYGLSLFDKGPILERFRGALTKVDNG